MSNQNSPSTPQLIEGIDYYLEKDRWIFTREYHLNRGNCCGNQCRHCPYVDWSQANSPPAIASPATGSPALTPTISTAAESGICPNCQRSFACSADACWCGSVVVPLEVLAELRQLFDGCLCPDCLRQFASRAHLSKGK